MRYNGCNARVGVDRVKNKLIRNVNLEQSETLLREFRNMPSRGRLCSMLVTNHRLIVYTYGKELVKGRSVRRQAMNEIELGSIHRYEYFYESVYFRVGWRMLGLLLFLGGAFVAVAQYMGAMTITIPNFVVEWYYPYVAAGLFALMGMQLMFHNTKTLYLKIKSGAAEVTALEFLPKRVNEEALKYIAGRIHAR
jgi:hypothetical protein